MEFNDELNAALKRVPLLFPGVILLANGGQLIPSELWDDWQAEAESMEGVG